MADTTGGTFKYWKNGLPATHVKVAANNSGTFKYWFNGLPTTNIFPSGESVSASPSVSPSASPSAGYSEYTKGDYVALPANDSDLETNYSTQDETDVATKDDVRVDQTGTQQYMIHQFKDFVGSSGFCSLEWEGQSTLAPSSSTVYLQIYNRNTNTWDTVDSDNSSSANTDFILLAQVADLTNYKNTGNVISCRVYQLAL